MSRGARLSAATAALGRTLLCALALAAAAWPHAAPAAQKVVLQLSREAQFRFAGYYAALWRGYFRDRGLDVVIKPGAATGGPPIDSVREVTEGRAQFGVGTSQLLVRAGDGLPLLLLAPIFQQSAARIYYRADEDFSAPDALLGATLGRLPESSFLDVELRSALIGEGIDPKKLRSRAIEPGEALDLLARGKIDAAIGSAWDLPWQAQQRGILLKSFDPGDYRTEFYGDGVFTVIRYAEQHPDIVRHFRAAVLAGWAYAFKHPEAIAQRIVTDLPAPKGIKDPAGFAHYQIGLARALAHYPAIPLGHSNPARWRNVARDLGKAGAIVRPVDLASFLYDPNAVARQQAAMERAGSIALAVVAGIIVASFLLWQFWRRRLHTGVARYGIRGPATARLLRKLAAAAEELRTATELTAGPLTELRRQVASQPQVLRLCDSARDGLERVRIVAGKLAQPFDSDAAKAPAVDLNAALTALAPKIRRGVPRNVNFRLSLSPEAWLCQADAEAVEEAILDLTGAALAQIGAGGEIVVGTRQISLDKTAAAKLGSASPGDYVRVTVKDSGPGMTPERLDRILDRRTSSSAPIVAASEAAERLGGFAKVESAEGVGTAVHLYFRRAAPPVPSEPGETPAKAAE